MCSNNGKQRERGGEHVLLYKKGGGGWVDPVDRQVAFLSEQVTDRKVGCVIPNIKAARDMSEAQHGMECSGINKWLLSQEDQAASRWI